MLNLLVLINDIVWYRVVLWLLLVAGLFFTFNLRAIQFTMFFKALGVLLSSRKSNGKKISSFQTLCASLAQRVGTGNLAGVATAITFGGKGAIFWMWVTALLGASTAFSESTLAQVFKVRKGDSFYGGPAYYIHAGLRNKHLAVLFSLCLVFALGFIFNAVQSNTIAQGLANCFDIHPLYYGSSLAIMAGAIIFGGPRRIFKTAELLVPVMAGIYILVTAYVLITNAPLVPKLIKEIFEQALAIKPAIGGAVGYSIREAFRYGVARGLFSNEAGWGSAPNAAASADVGHPAEQGLIQMLAVFIDTIVICSLTAFFILLSEHKEGLTGIALTQAAAQYHFGIVGKYFIALAIVLFGFTTIVGNTFYGETNIKFICQKAWVINAYRIIVLLMVILGTMIEVPTMWQLADLMSAVMVIINLFSILLMTTIIKKTYNHFRIKYFSTKESYFSFDKIGLLNVHGYDFFYDKENLHRSLDNKPLNDK